MHLIIKVTSSLSVYNTLTADDNVHRLIKMPKIAKTGLLLWEK